MANFDFLISTSCFTVIVSQAVKSKVVGFAA